MEFRIADTFTESLARLTGEQKEIKTVSAWLTKRMKAGVAPHECGVFVRSAAELDRARAAVKEAGIPFKILKGRNPFRAPPWTMTRTK